MKNTILFLDDDQYDMKPFVEKLEKENFNVKSFAEPEEALEFLKSVRSPDLIIADLIMRTSPDESAEEAHYVGIIFCKTVREELKLKCPIIVLSVVSDPAIQTEVRKYANIFLTKPILPFELVREVKGLLK